MKKLLAIALLLVTPVLFAGTGANGSAHNDGSPIFLTGDLGSVDLRNVEADSVRFLRGNAASLFGATGSEEHAVSRVKRDAQGNTHVLVQQKLRGLPVYGAEMLIHADSNGRVFAMNGRFASERNAPRAARVDASRAFARAAEALRVSFWRQLTAPQLVYVVNEKGTLFLAHMARFAYTDADGEQIDKVFADAVTGEYVTRYPEFHRVMNRKTYSANNGTSLPGTLRISEGGALTNDAAIDSAHTNAGTVYNYYKTRFNRDSYNNAGATITSTAHYSSNYNNAYWNSSQMVYGDGDGTTFIALSRAFDVVAHELTHAVTEYEANLVYQNESGALNEAMSDIMAAAAEYYKVGSINSNTWKVGEDCYTPATSGDALRYMNNPTQDGSSRDYYPERYTGTQDNGGVHWNSGIANLAFYLLSQGGTHPRSKTTVTVPAVGIAKAEQIFYSALANYMTSSTTFQGARNATASAATALYGAASAEVAAVHKAWDAVGVPGTPGDGGTTTLTNGVPVSNLSASTGAWKHYKLVVPTGQTKLEIKISGGTGDADLYVKRGTPPTSTSYDYRPYLSGNNETVTVTNPVAGDWYISIYAYAAYSGVTLVGTYSTTTGTCTTYTGSLSGTGAAAYQPSSSGYATTTTGSHTGKLTGTGTDFDLYLQKWNGSSWANVASGTGSTSTENVTYSGTSGSYRWRIYSYSGSGTYSLCTTRPN